MFFWLFVCLFVLLLLLFVVDVVLVAVVAVVVGAVVVGAVGVVVALVAVLVGVTIRNDNDGNHNCFMDGCHVETNENNYWPNKGGNNKHDLLNKENRIC